ncbi:MAG: hypothetical protein JXB39_02480 [Deltaproteobacteria bacterium]|nr:hypothetical protein [Deltaproteobacteria bacterium]
MTRTLLALALAGLLLPEVAEAKKRPRAQDTDREKPKHERLLSMEKGTWQLGGSATIDFSKVGDASDLWLNLSPDVGYFVANRWEILGQADILYNEDAAWGIGAGIRYHFDMRPSWIYLGALGTYSDDRVYALGAPLGIQLQGGLLYPLARNVALDVGLRANAWLPEEGDTFFSGGLGYLGVQGYWR